MNKIKLKKLLKELRTEGTVDVIPDGYFSREELCKALNRKRDYVCRLIKSKKEANPSKFKAKRFKVRNTFGGINSVPHYKFDL